MKLPPEIAAELWGEDLPYSQVYLLREIRVLGKGVSREFYYVYSHVNPATYKILKKHKSKIKEDFIHMFLETAEYKSPEEGYEWHTGGVEIDGTENSQAMVEEHLEMVKKMHRIVMDLLYLAHD